MPCYDKKLEASRQDFYNELYSTRDVDCVITTGELELLMKERGWDLSVPVDGEADASISFSLPNASSPSSASLPIRLPELLQHPGSSSGSYLHSIIAHLQRPSPTPLVLVVKIIRNADYEEYVLTDHGRVVFKGAKCYGFRNLQNVVRKVGKERGVRTGTGAAGRLAGRAVGRRVVRKGGAGMMEDRSYDYVEVMACPGGCVNGGGQLKPRVDEEKYERNWEENGVSVDAGGMQNAKWGDKDWTKKVEDAYWRDSRMHDLPPTPPDTPPLQVLDDRDAVADHILEELCGEDGDRRRELLRTSYRAVESDVVGLAVKW